MSRNRTKRGIQLALTSFGAVLLYAFAIGSLPAQTHKVARPATVVRSVGVYEWLGDMAKPAASRLIPVTLFLDSKLQDAGVYLASPVPLALLTGNVYELQKSGVALGTLNLAFARHLVAAGTAATAYDDGWFGYGKFVPPATARKSTLKPSATLAKIDRTDGIDEDNSTPHFSSRSATPGSGGAATPDSGTAPSPSETPANDPDRPTLHRSASGSDTTANAGSTPGDDPDRPTLRHRSPDTAKDAKADRPSVTPVANSLNDDPNRPVLHRGKPLSSMNDADIPKLAGLPAEQDLHQVVAVSDAADHTPHDFSRPWDDESEHQAILQKMQTAARAQLAAYEGANGKAAASGPAPATPKSAAGSAVRSQRSAIRQAAVPKPPPPPESLLDEKLSGFTLSYGGAATYVYSAHTGGLSSAQRFVTLVAQVNMQSEPEIALKDVTDASHLDRTPRMRLVDAVDAEASNRASLLFELRAQNSRQFALYRVIGARADQTFLTGSTQ